MTVTLLCSLKLKEEKELKEKPHNIVTLAAVPPLAPCGEKALKFR